jgi:hypothetical protein
MGGFDALELSTVKWALYRGSLEDPSRTQVRPHMGAIGVECEKNSVVASNESDSLTEERVRSHLLKRNLVGPDQRIPTNRQTHRRAVSFTRLDTAGHVFPPSSPLAQVPVVRAVIYSRRGQTRSSSHPM